MNCFLLSFYLLSALTAFTQYPFEKFTPIPYNEYSNWQTNHEEGKDEHSITIPKFFNKKNALVICLTSYPGKWDSSFITVSRDSKQVQQLYEPVFFGSVLTALPARLADINGDGLADVKLVVPYVGNGIAAMNVRVIYLFQNKDGTFTKISFLDKMGEKEAGDNRVERDMDGDGNYEIITQALMEYEGHSYWLFNLFNYKNNELVSVNNKFNYPILIQFLYRKNYSITNKMTRNKMKAFAQKKPEEYDKR